MPKKSRLQKLADDALNDPPAPRHKCTNCLNGDGWVQVSVPCPCCKGDKSGYLPPQKVYILAPELLSQLKDQHDALNDETGRNHMPSVCPTCKLIAKAEDR